MEKDDYIAAGGALNLKGVKPTGITKKKKKKKAATAAEGTLASEKSASPDPAQPEKKQSEEPQIAGDDDDDDPFRGKTEAERRFEKRRRELLKKRLAKEGVKTHKERVDEYNKYLASLSEHHDMPRIGPG